MIPLGWQEEKCKRCSCKNIEQEKDAYFLVPGSCSQIKALNQKEIKKLRGIQTPKIGPIS